MPKPRSSSSLLLPSSKSSSQQPLKNIVEEEEIEDERDNMESDANTLIKSLNADDFKNYSKDNVSVVALRIIDEFEKVKIKKLDNMTKKQKEPLLKALIRLNIDIKDTKTLSSIKKKVNDEFTSSSKK